MKLASAWIFCYFVSDTTLAKAVPEGSVRLVGGSGAHEGRLEMYKLGHWGTVCNVNWDLADATVVCLQLGYTLASSLPMRAVYGQGNGTIWLYNATCTGFEERLTECNNSGVGVHNCLHFHDVSIQCSSRFTSRIYYTSCTVFKTKTNMLKLTHAAQLYPSLFISRYDYQQNSD